MNTFEIISTSEFVEEDIALPFSIRKGKRKMFFFLLAQTSSDLLWLQTFTYWVAIIYSALFEKDIAVLARKRKKETTAIRSMSEQGKKRIIHCNAENKNDYTRPYFPIIQVRSLIHEFKYFITIIYYNNKNMYQTADQCCKLN